MKTILRLISLAALLALPVAAQTVYPSVQRSTLLVSTRVPFSDSAGRLTDDADLAFVTDTLTATKIVGSTSITDSGLTATRVTFAGTAGLLSDDADLTFATDTLTFTKGLAPTSLMVGNGTASNLLSALTVYDTGTSLPRGISNVQVSSGADSANFSGYKARGTPGSLTTIVTGDLLANIRAWGYDGANYINSGSMRWTSEGTIASTRVPSKAEIMVSTDATPSVLTTTASFSGKDGIALTAVGTNQSITLTPSGTGSLLVGGTTKLTTLGTKMEVQFDGSLGANLYLTDTQTSSVNVGGSLAFAGYSTAQTTMARFGRINGAKENASAGNFAGYLSFLTNANGGQTTLVEGMRLTSASHLLLGGLTTDGTGVLQFPAATTSAGGLNLGGEIFFFRTGTNTAQISASSGLAITGTITSYNGIATAGNGVVTVQGAGRSTAQTAAVGSVATYTVGASDASFEVSANVLVTTSTTHSFTATCAYTDESNVARTLTLSFSGLTGTFLTAITNVTGAGPYEGVPMHIRCKASTAITIATAGTFTTVTYNVEGNIRKLQ